MIVTFYSFKGGTGRTMALANIAVLLARAGKKVLAVDFDLEAPGLWRFFQELKPDLDKRDGLLDMLIAQSAHSSSGRVNWRDYVIPLYFEEKSISLITSGRRDDGGYPTRILEFTWNELYRKNDGSSFIEQLRTEWTETFDFTLIDSRTGITDTGGVCTIALPDLIVPVFVANHQSVEGTLEILTLAQKSRQNFAYDRPPALVLPLLSRFDTRTEYETADYWLDLLAEKLGKLYADWLPANIPPRRILERTKLPYVAYFSFGEKLAVLREGVSDPDSLGYALNSVSRLIESQLGDAAAVAGVSMSAPDTIASLPTKPYDRMLASAPSIVGGVPPQNPNFTGRDEMLRDIRRTLRPHSHTAMRPHTLHGLGGVGKTQLAVEYVHRHLSDYELVWWIPADHESSVRRSLVSLARRLGLPESDDVRFTVQTVLDELGGGRPSPNWLLIYDNAGEPGGVRPYLPSGPGQVLITSRNRDWSNESMIVEVDVFTEEESNQFLARRWADISDEDARTLAGELGHLPLALDQAVSFHKVTAMPLAEYLQLLRRSPGLMLDEGESSEYPQSVAKTCRLAYEKLRERSLGGAQLLQVCSFFGSSAIAVPMLARGRSAPLPSPLAETLQDGIKLREAIREIGRYALAQLDASRDFIKIHTLVGALLRDALPKDQREATERAGHMLLAMANPGAPDDASTWQQHAEVAPHVIPSGVINSDDPEVRRVVLDQIRYFFVSGNYVESATLAERAVETWEASLGSDDEMVLTASFHLGNAFRATCDYRRAREINEQTLDRMQRSLGPNHELTLRVANSQGADLRILGDFRKAREVDMDTLQRYQHTRGEDDAPTLRSANNLAVDDRLLGLIGEARATDESTLERRRRLLGDNHREVLSSINGVVRGRYDHGDYEDALALGRESVARYELLLPNHPFLLLAMRNLAILERMTGHYQRSLALSQTNFNQSVSLFGPRHEHSLASMMTLCNALHSCDDPAQACDLGEAALQSYSEQFGAEHPFTLACSSNLTIVYRTLGRLDEAGAIDSMTSLALARTLPEDHPYALCCACGVSNNLFMRGMTAEARAISKDAYERSKRLLVPDHPMTLALAANLALDLEGTGAARKAAELRKLAVERLRRRLGREHPLTVRVERGHRCEWEIEVPPM